MSEPQPDLMACAPTWTLAVVRAFRVQRPLHRGAVRRDAAAAARLRDAAARRWPSVAWKTEVCTIDGGAPSFFTAAGASWVRAVLPAPPFPAPRTPWVGPGAAFEVVETAQEILLYDGTAGVVEVRVTLRLRGAAAGALDPLAGAALLDVGNAVADTMATPDEEVAALSEPPSGAAADGRSAARCFPWFGVTLVASRGRTDGLPVPRALVDGFVGGSAGSGRADQASPCWPGLAELHDGFGGQFVLLDASVEGVDVVRARIEGLWRLAVLNLSRLWVVNRELASRTARLLDGARRPERQLESLRREGVAMQVCLRESSPVTVCADVLEKAVYGGLWDRWGGPALSEEIRDELEFLQEHFHQTASLLEARMQRRMAWILFLLNLAAFSTAIASLITTYDVRNDVLAPDLRLRIILAGTFGLLAIALLVVFLRPWDRRRGLGSAED